MTGTSIQIELTGEANQVVSNLCDRRGWVKKRLVQQVLEWFAGQDATTQALVLSAIEPADRQAVAQIVLARIAERSDPDPDPTLVQDVTGSAPVPESRLSSPRPAPTPESPNGSPR